MTHDLAKNAARLILFQLGKQMYSEKHQNEASSSSSTTSSTAAPAAATTITTKEETKNDTPLIKTNRPRASSVDPPAVSLYVGKKTLEFRIDLNEPQACKISHHNKEKSIYLGLWH